MTIHIVQSSKSDTIRDKHNDAYRLLIFVLFFLYLLIYAMNTKIFSMKGKADRSLLMLTISHSIVAYLIK